MAESTTQRQQSILQGIQWSGNERNHTFFGGVKDKVFEDYSGVTGLDDPGDTRAFSLMDYDRDGRIDLALASEGKPRFRLMRNSIGDRVGESHDFIAVRLVGGNHSPDPSKEWSARDAYGTSISLDLGETRLFRQHQPEGGFLGQNSNTMIVGIGDNDQVRHVQIRWLSGKRQSFDNVPARKLITVYENPQQSPNGEALVIEDYLRETPRALTRHVDTPNYWRKRWMPTPPSTSKLELTHNGTPLTSDSGMTVIATMATWCVACVEEMPEFRSLREAFSQDELAIHAVPVDQEDTAKMLSSWSDRHNPPYEIAVGIDASQVQSVNEVTLAELRADAVPATFVVNSKGAVLLSRWGVPTISDIRKFLWQEQKE